MKERILTVNKHLTSSEVNEAPFYPTGYLIPAAARSCHSQTDTHKKPKLLLTPHHPVYRLYLVSIHASCELRVNKCSAN
jgi:hypothetical protein